MQADLEFEACLDYRVKSRTTRATQKPCLKNKKIFKKFYSFANFVYGGVSHPAACVSRSEASFPLGPILVLCGFWGLNLDQAPLLSNLTVYAR